MIAGVVTPFAGPFHDVPRWPDRSGCESMRLLNLETPQIIMPGALLSSILSAHTINQFINVPQIAFGE
jgi:hypothetical protein